MRNKSETADYEGVFPPKFSRRESPPAEASQAIKPEIGFGLSGAAAALPSNLAPAISSKQKNPKPTFMELEAGQWKSQRGHALTFACLFVFSIVLYLRP
jgi:hypothetical protein